MVGDEEIDESADDDEEIAHLGDGGDNVICRIVSEVHGVVSDHDEDQKGRSDGTDGSLTLLGSEEEEEIESDEENKDEDLDDELHQGNDVVRDARDSVLDQVIDDQRDPRDEEEEMGLGDRSCCFLFL